MATESKSHGFFSRLVKGGSGAKDDDDSKTSHTKRREQVRKAQRTHRERKEKYVRSLEVEVANLRERDAQCVQEVENYKQMIRQLQDLLTAHGIPIPPHLLLPRTPSPQASVCLVDLPDGSQGLQATMPNFEDFRRAQQQSDTSMSPHQDSTSTGDITTSISHTSSTIPEALSFQINTINLSSQPMYHTTPNTFDPQMSSSSPSQYSSNLSQANPDPSTSRMPHPTGLDSAQTAVDFVLALEKPCLTHHPSNPYDTTLDSCGHSLMLQSPIMSRYPQPVSEARCDTSTIWSVPAIEIEKLLNLSARLSLEGEITPIEAWQKLRRHPRFVNMTRERLDVLKVVLLGEVHCYGFGAVMDEEYFDLLSQQAIQGF